MKTVSIDVRKNGCGNSGVSGPVEDRNLISCGDVTVTVQTFIVTIIRDIRMCICILLTQNIALLQNIPTQSHECN